jgi:WD40 repeat protein
MTDIFISYSRKDIAYARLLHESLKENEFETWIDWQDIPPSTDWLREVYTAIETANTFIFILSGSSTISDICKLEIEHAKKNNKRLIPILIDDVDPKNVHPVLAAINWIFSRTQDEFQPAIQNLIEAIQTDYDWVKAHTRLQMRALEWERTGNDKSFLLQGTDLDQAENWISVAAEKEPEPTLLQTRYIQSSRQEAVKKQRRLLLAVGAALIVTIVLGVVALLNGQRATQSAVSLSTQVVVAQDAEATAEQEAHFRATQQAIAEQQREIAEEQQAIAEEQREIALEQQAIAEEQRDIAISQQLSANALNNREEHLDLSLLLSSEAIKRANTLEARTSLLNGITYSPRLVKFLHGNPISPQYAAAYPSNHRLVISPDGKTVACGNTNGQIILWDIESAQPLGTPLTGHSSEVTSLAFSADGSILASGDYDRRLILWDVSTLQMIGLPLSAPDRHVDFRVLIVPGINSIVFSPDGLTITAGYANKDINRWLIETGELIFEHPGERLPDIPSIQHPTTFNSTGSLIAIGLADRSVAIYEVESGQEIFRTSPLDIGLPETLAFSPDDHLLALGGSNGQIFLWDLTTEQLEPQLIVKSNYIESLAFSPDSTILVSGGWYSEIILWDINSGKAIGDPLIGHTGAVRSLAFSPDGQHLISFDSDNSVLVWDLSMEPTYLGYTFNTDHQIDFITFTPPNNDHILLLGGLGYYHETDANEFIMTAWDLSKIPYLDGTTFFVGPNSADCAINHDGRIMACAGFTWQIFLWDMEIHEVVGEPIDGFRKCMAINSDGTLLSLLVSWNSKEIILWDVQKGEVFLEPLIGDATVSAAVFSHDGKFLVSGDTKGNIYLWDLTSNKPIGQILEDKKPYPMRVNDLVISPDDRKLVAYLEDYIGFWDIASGKMIGQLISFPGEQWGSMALSPDGLILATTGTSVSLWDMEKHQLLGQIPIKGLNDLAFSSDGNTLAIGAIRRIVLWDMSLEGWMNQACSVANRNLTQEEWALYLPFEPYHKTCPQFP